MQATSYVDLLPTELYPMIIEHIGFDLISHVYFSQLNARIEACYRCLGRAFWEPVCRASGLACQPAEHASLTNEDWADLAFECAGHALSCQHPACGMGRLRENERLMRKHVVDGLDLMDTLPRDDVRDVEPISVWKDIAFKSNVRWARSIDTWRNTTCLRIVEEGYIGRAGPLHEHPVIWRSFAAFPPVPKMNLCTIDIPDPSNDNGVIVADMLDAIIDRSKATIRNSEFRGLMATVDTHEKGIFPKSWSCEEMFSSLEHFRSWFTVVHWAGLNYLHTSSNGPWFDWDFRVQDLPQDYHEFLKNHQ